MFKNVEKKDEVRNFLKEELGLKKLEQERTLNILTDAVSIWADDLESGELDSCQFENLVYLELENYFKYDDDEAFWYLKDFAGSDRFQKFCFLNFTEDDLYTFDDLMERIKKDITSEYRLIANLYLANLFNQIEVELEKLIVK